MTKRFTLALLGALAAAPLAAHAQQAPRQPGDPSATAYQGGIGSPFSTRASNIKPSDTRSDIAPRLPSPDAVPNAGPNASVDDTRTMLMSANRALQYNQTGAAQEALERAETRELTRAVDPALANRPDKALMVQGIADARSALGSNDVSRARAIVEHLLNP